MKNIFTTKRASIIIGILALLGVIASQLGHPMSKLEQNVANDLPKQEFTIPALPRGESVTVLALGLKKYTHSLLGFSFEYPAQFSISSFGSAYDDTGETVLLQGGKEEKGLQVLITPFDEDVALTEERIHRDIPDLVMFDVATQTLGNEKKTVQAVVFTSTNSFMGKSVEAWFVRNGQLYQLSAPAAAQDVFTKALDSWEF